MQMKTLAEVIHREIVEHEGVLPFSRFMELALYCPKLGYYEAKKDRVGRQGDFFTSVSTGSLFGELLAFQFAEWLGGLDTADQRLSIVEAGAHDGRLAKDILGWLQSHRAQLFKRLDYSIVEPSDIRQAWQRETLKDFSLHWQSGFDSLGSICGIIFSNELLDAFPVRRFGWDAGQKKWFEWGVATQGESFAWCKMALAENAAPPSIHHLPSSLLDVLPNEFTIETSHAAKAWWRAAADYLQAGKLMTLDYGLTEEEFFLPSRKNGTLRAFFQHHFADDLLARPGEQDLTAHVNFSVIQRAGEDAGLKTDAFSSQAKFLTRILEKTLKDKSFGDWTPARTRQFQTLTHPEHLGRAFQVLVQSR
jgi:SAM-dependent MidA family methyltransferase